MVYDWHTLLACDNATIPLDQVDKCSFKRPDFFGRSLQQPIDLRHFGLSQMVVGSTTLSVNPCAGTGHCNGTVCAKAGLIFVQRHYYLFKRQMPIFSQAHSHHI